MEVISNIDSLLGDDLKVTLEKDTKVSIAASCFSIYAYEALKKELEQVKEIRFIFTSPTFVSDPLKKEKREFYIPKLGREKSLYGSEFEISYSLGSKSSLRSLRKFIEYIIKYNKVNKLR